MSAKSSGLRSGQLNAGFSVVPRYGNQRSANVLWLHQVGGTNLSLRTDNLNASLAFISL
jgi:hypothetical protein